MNEILSINNTRLTNNPLMLDYLRLLANLITNLSNKQLQYEFEDSLYGQEAAADHDDDSDSDTEPSPVSVKENSILIRCVELLNNENRSVMVTCSQITENDLSDEFLEYTSKICHSLLLSHKLALHKYR